MKKLFKSSNLKYYTEITGRKQMKKALKAHVNNKPDVNRDAIPSKKELKNEIKVCSYCNTETLLKVCARCANVICYF